MREVVKTVKTEKLLLTEFNRILCKENIVFMRIEQNQMKSYRFLAEINNGEIVTIAVITDVKTARKFALKLRLWLQSTEDCPFHTQYEINHIMRR